MKFSTASGSRLRYAMLAMGLLLAAAAVWQRGPLLRLMTTRTFYEQRRDTAGRVDGVFLRRVHRWKNGSAVFIGEQIGWHPESGFMSLRAHFRTDQSGTWTWWTPDGRVEKQGELSSTSTWSEPSWRWGVTDQSKPTAPWTLEGVSMAAWWEALPEGFKGTDPSVKKFKLPQSGR